MDTKNNKDKKIKECVERRISVIGGAHWLRSVKEQRLKFLRSLDFSQLYQELKESNEDDWSKIADSAIDKELTKEGYSISYVARTKSFDFNESDLGISLVFKGRDLEPFVRVDVDSKRGDSGVSFRADKDQLQEIIVALQDMRKEMK